MKTTLNSRPSIRQVGRVTPCAPGIGNTTAARRGLTRPTNMRLALLLPLCGCLLATLTAARAATNTVLNLNDSGPGSLRQAIADAAPGDTIDFAVTGTITLTSGELVVDKDLTISGPGAANLTVSGNNASRVFSFTNVTSDLSGLAIANGHISTGAGAGIINNGSLVLSNCLIHSNTNNGFGSPNYGGGIFNSGTLSIFDSEITRNYANLTGAGIATRAGVAILVNTLVSSNRSTFGAALTSIQSGADLRVLNSIVFENRSGNGPAGIEVVNASLIMSNSTILKNVTQSGTGGGIYGSGSSSVLVIASTISSNTALTGGGMFNAGTTLIMDTTIAFNTASAGAGGISSQGGSLSVVNCTITGNRALSGVAGGIYNGATLALTNSTIANNSSAQGGNGIYTTTPTPITRGRNSIVFGNTGPDPKDIYGPFNSQDFNLIGNTNGATITGVTTHNLYGQDPLLSPLADNGGPTPTHALLPGSPAIDHGSSGGLATDQRGLPRPFNFPAYFDADDASDIGAVEMQEGPQIGPVFTVNSTNDVDDGVAGIAHCSLREAIAAANANADTNTIDFAAEVPGVHAGVTGTITLTNGQLTITNSVNINGPGAADLTVSGNNSNRVFQFSSVPSGLISGLTVANGYAAGQNGGGIFISGAGTLTISLCNLMGNRASSGGAIATANSPTINLFSSMLCSNYAAGGGGIHNPSFGTVNVVNSTIVSNRADSFGGGINNSGYLRLTNSTVSQNSLILNGGEGGGIAAQTLNIIVNSTICSNSAPNSGGGIYFLGGDFFDHTIIQNSLIAGNSASSGPDCRATASAPIDSLDYNLIQNTNGCTITNLTAHNLYNQDPKLGPLADLGGATPTHALRFDSPALDAAHSGGLTTDQRGLPRPIDDPNTPNAAGGDGSDIGAYEADPNLRITAIEKVGDDIRLRFNTLFGKTYDVESEDNLDDSWGPLTNNIPGTGGGFQALDAGAASLPQRFYRAVQLP